MKIITNSAISLDGKIGFTGKSQIGLGSKNDLKRLLQIRNLADAILVGGNTYRNWPHASLSEKLISQKSEKPIWNIILSQSLNLKFDKKYLNESRVKKLCLTSRKTVPKNFPIPIVKCKQKIKPNWIVSQLGKMGIKTLLIEGGGAVIAPFLEANLVDEMYVTLCPVIVGNAKSPSLVGSLSKIRKLKELSRDIIGNEIFFHYRVK